MSTCDICDEKKENVRMYSAGSNGLTKGAEYFIRQEVERITNKQISFFPLICFGCYKKWGFAEKLRSRKSHRW